LQDTFVYITICYCQKVILQAVENQEMFMDRIGIVTEEAVDLLPATIEEHRIAIVPAILIWPELEEMPGENTFQKMRELEKRGIRSFGKTSQPTPNDFLEKYQHQIERFDKVLCITLTSKLSGSYNSAVLARKLLKPEEQQRILIVDSLNASCGQALVVLKAIDLIMSGRELQDIVNQLQEFIHHVYLFAMFQDPKWLGNSGRISRKVANLMRGMARIGIRPLLTFSKGKLVPVGLKSKARDTAEVLFRQLDKDTEKARKAGKRIRMAITHGDDSEAALRLKEMAEKLENIEVSFINIINNVIGVVTGPNTLAFAWCEI
jgi:DegV family protein with EDD domain